MYNGPGSSPFDKEGNENGKKYTQPTMRPHPQSQSKSPLNHTHTHSPTQPQRWPNSHTADHTWPQVQSHTHLSSADRHTYRDRTMAHHSTSPPVPIRSHQQPTPLPIQPSTPRTAHPRPPHSRPTPPVLTHCRHTPPARPAGNLSLAPNIPLKAR